LLARIGSRQASAAGMSDTVFCVRGYERSLSRRPANDDNHLKFPPVLKYVVICDARYLAPLNDALDSPRQLPSRSGESKASAPPAHKRCRSSRRREIDAPAAICGDRWHGDERHRAAPPPQLVGKVPWVVMTGSACSSAAIKLVRVGRRRLGITRFIQTGGNRNGKSHGCERPGRVKRIRET